MLDPIGTASWSSLNMLISTMGMITLRERGSLNVFVDSIMTYFMKPVQMDSVIEVYAEIIDTGRSFCKVEVNMFDSKSNLIAKTILSSKIMRK